MLDHPEEETGAVAGEPRDSDEGGRRREGERHHRGGRDRRRRDHRQGGAASRRANRGADARGDPGAQPRRTRTRGTSREAADSYGTQHRRTVEEEARRLLAEAEEQAKTLLETAEAKAGEIERTSSSGMRRSSAR